MQKRLLITFIFVVLCSLFTAAAREQPVIIDDFDSQTKAWEFRVDRQATIEGIITLPDLETKIEGIGSMRIDYQGKPGADGGPLGGCYAIVFPDQDWSRVEKIIFWIKGTSSSGGNWINLFVEGGGAGAKATSYSLGAINNYQSWQKIEIPISELDFQPRTFVYSIRFWIGGVSEGDTGTVWIDYLSTIGLGVLECKVVDGETDSLPVANAQVELTGDYKNYLGITNEQGEVMFENVVAGQYDYIVRAPGYETLRGKVFIPEDEAVSMSFPVQPQSLDTIMNFKVTPKIAPQLGGQAKIEYALALPADVKIELVAGGVETAIFEGTQAAGEYSLLWDGRIGGGFCEPGQCQIKITAARGEKKDEKSAPLEVGTAGPRFAFSPLIKPLEINLSLDEMSHVEFQVTNLRGQKVYEFDYGNRSGVVKLIWDGKAEGEVLPEGTYRYSVIVTPISGEGSLAYQGDILLDQTPPKRPILLLPTEGYEATSIGPVELKWQSNEVSSSILRYGQTSDLRDAVELVVPGDSAKLELQAGSYWYWQVIVLDEAGNMSEPSSIGSFKVSPTSTNKPGIEFLGVMPNPFSPNGDGYRDEAIISYKNLRPAEVTVKIRNLAGQLVWTNTSFQLAGDQFIAWDGRDLKGRLVHTGLYLLEIEAKAEGGWPPARARAVVNIIR